MRIWIVLGISLLLTVAIVALGYQPAVQAWRKQSMPKWRTADVAEGDIMAVVNATGSIKPVLQVSVGSFVSGPIDSEYELKYHDGRPIRDALGQPLHLAEFNQEVTKGDEMAKIDPRIYQAQVDSAQANLNSRIADVARVETLLELAKRDEQRANDLKEEDEFFIAKAEIDRVKYGRIGLEKQLDLAIAAKSQADYQVQRAKADLDYCTIKAPVSGIVIKRTIDPGQTLAAQFQAPELFIVAPDMRKTMHVHASVDEADIGLIGKARDRKLAVSFTVDAYDELFHGEVEEIRLSSTTTQNVVTYPVVVAAANQDMKLLPGMTANISFEVDRADQVVKIPNSALRFFPNPQHVRKEDKPLVEGKAAADEEEKEVAEETLSATDRAAARAARSRRHVWVVDNYQLRAVEVVVGIADSKYSQLVSGDLKVGDKLVIGIQQSVAGWGG